MQSKAILLTGLLLALALVPVPSTAQDGAEGALYFTNKLVSDGTVNGASSGGPKVFEATPAAPTAATDQKAYANVGTGAAAFETQFTWKATQAFTLAGKVTAHFWVSCDVATVYRPAATYWARFTFLKNGAAIGTATTITDASPVACSGPTSIRDVTIQDDSADTAFKVGDTITAGFAIWMESPPETAAKNVHFLVGGAKHPSQIHAAGLPVPGGEAPKAPAVIEAALNGSAGEVHQTFANATSGAYRFNWTTNLTDVEMQLDLDVSNGSVTVMVRDPSGAQRYNRTFTASNGTANETRLFANETAGQWTIDLVYSGCAGSLNLVLAAPAPVPAPSPSNTTGGPHNSTSSATSTPKGKSGIPGFEPAAACGAVAVALAVLRRRA